MTHNHKLYNHLVFQFTPCLLAQADAQNVLTKAISHINAESKREITQGFAVSSKTGAGIEALKAALAKMVPTKAVPSSYEKLLKQLRVQSGRAKSPFLMAEDAQLLGLSSKVCFVPN